MARTNSVNGNQWKTFSQVCEESRDEATRSSGVHVGTGPHAPAGGGIAHNSPTSSPFLATCGGFALPVRDDLALM